MTRERLKALVAGLKAVPEQLRSLVEERYRQSEELAQRFENTQDVIFLGRGINRRSAASTPRSIRLVR